MNIQTQAYLYAAASILCWSTVASAFKLSLAYLHFSNLLFYSSFTALCMLLVILLVSGRLGELKTWSCREYLRSAGMGFLNPFLYYLVLFKAYSLLPAQEAQPLNFVWPIFLVLLSILVLRQKIHLISLLAMGISLLGVLAISTRGNILGWRVTDGLGVALALGSAVIWALYWIYGIKDNHDPVVRLCLNFAFGFVFVTLYLAFTEEFRMPPLKGLFGAVYVGLFEMGLTFVFWLKALKLSRTTAQVSQLIYLTPFLSLLVIHFAVGESIYPSTLIGLVLIVTGILLQQYGEQLLKKAIAKSRA